MILSKEPDSAQGRRIFTLPLVCASVAIFAATACSSATVASTVDGGGDATSAHMSSKDSGSDSKGHPSSDTGSGTSDAKKPVSDASRDSGAASDSGTQHALDAGGGDARGGGDAGVDASHSRTDASQSGGDAGIVRGDAGIWEFNGYCGSDFDFSCAGAVRCPSESAGIAGFGCTPARGRCADIASSPDGGIVTVDAAVLARLFVCDPTSTSVWATSAICNGPFGDGGLCAMGAAACPTSFPDGGVGIAGEPCTPAGARCSGSSRIFSCEATGRLVWELNTYCGDGPTEVCPTTDEACPTEGGVITSGQGCTTAGTRCLLDHQIFDCIQR